jgi:hypothetical protein
MSAKPVLQPWSHGDRGPAGDDPELHPGFLWDHLRTGYDQIRNELKHFERSRTNPPEEWRTSPLSPEQNLDQAARNALAVVRSVASVARGYRVHELPKHAEVAAPLGYHRDRSIRCP